MKKSKIGIFVLLIGSVVFGLTSCKTTNVEKKTYEYGDFKFKVLKGTNEFTIVGLTDEGKTKETLVLPTIVEGKKVTTIGYNEDFLLDDSVSGLWTVDFSGATYKNFYVHSLLKKCDYKVGSKIHNAITQGNFYYPSFLEREVKGILCIEPDNGFTTEKAKKDLLEETPTALLPKYYQSVNVIYYMNDDTDNAFFVDDCDGTTVNVIPPDPYRIGYEFAGWYKEKECINSFDFENDIIPNKEYDEENNYILKENNIYAKWEVIK